MRYFIISKITIIFLLIFLSGCRSNNENIPVSNGNENEYITNNETTEIEIGSTPQTIIATSVDTEITIAQITEITALTTSEMNMNEHYEYNVYFDKFDYYQNKSNIILSVTPEKIYWNNQWEQVPSYPNYIWTPIIEGEPMDICLPAALFNVFSSADSILLYYYINYIDIGEVDNFESHNFIFGIPEGSNWYMDEIIPIKDGRIKFYTKDDLINDYHTTNHDISYKSFLLDGSMFTEKKFKDNITVDEFEDFLNELEGKYDEMKNYRNENPDMIIELANYECSMYNGIFLRAKINKIY